MINLEILKKIIDVLDTSQRRQAITLLILMFIGMTMETLGIGLVIPVLAIMTEPDITSKYPVLSPVLEALGNPDHVELAIGSMLLLVAVYTLKASFLTYLVWKQTRFAYGILVSLSQRLFKGYIHQPYTFHLQRNSAQLIQNVSGEVQLFSYSTLVAANTLTDMLVLSGIAILLLFVEPVGALIVIVILGLTGGLFYGLNKSRVLKWGETRQYNDGKRIQHLQQGFGGVKDVKLLGREEDFFKQFALHNQTSARTNEKQTVMQAVPRLLLEWLAVIAMAVLVFSMLAQGSDVQSLIPTLGLFVAAAFRLIPSVNRVLSGLQYVRYSLPVFNTLHAEVQDLAEEPVEGVSSSIEFKNEIRLTNVGYRYEGSEDITLSDISLTIPKGTSVGFIGGSGAGKSTLIDIVIGLLIPNSGQVLIDDKDIQENLRGWQDKIGYVPQSIYLTDDSLRRNVAFGLPDEDINEDAVIAAIKAAQLEEFVANLPDGLDTLVGERGVRISGGQRQRIGIARALYHGPEVLVLDEATSSLDTTTEKGVMEAVYALHGEKTILIVAHRLSTVSQCDMLYRIEQGHLSRDSEFDQAVNIQ